MLSDGLSPWVRSDLRPRAPTPCTGWAPPPPCHIPEDRVRSVCGDRRARGALPVGRVRRTGAGAASWMTGVSSAAEGCSEHGRRLGLQRLQRLSARQTRPWRRRGSAGASRSCGCRCHRGSGPCRRRRPPSRRSSNSSTSMRSARARRQAATATRRASTSCRGAFRHQLVDQRGLERLKLDGVLVRQHDVVQGAHAVPQRILRRARLAHGRLRPARLRAVLATGRGAGTATGTAAPSAAPSFDRRDSSGWRWLEGGRWTRERRAGARKRQSSR